MRVEKGEGESWAVPLSSFVAGCEMLKGGLLVGYALMDLADPGDPELLSDVYEMISAHSANSSYYSPHNKEPNPQQAKQGHAQIKKCL